MPLPNQQQHPFVFESLEPRQVDVTIEGRAHLLKEASEAASVRWRNAQVGSARIGADGKINRIGDIADAEPLLLSDCLFEKSGEGVNPPLKPVPVATIRSWPSRVVKPLVEWVMRSSGLEERETKETLEKRLAEVQEKLASIKEEEDAKKAPEATTAT